MSNDSSRQDFELRTPAEAFVDITARVQERVTASGVANGICTVFVPHTTAGVTINENADPDVLHDLLLALNHAVPEQSAFRHAEGNSTAHVKSSLMGSAQTILIRDGRLALGTWQGIYFAEFDGPRTRRVWIDIRF